MYIYKYIKCILYVYIKHIYVFMYVYNGCHRAEQPRKIQKSEAFYFDFYNFTSLAPVGLEFAPLIRVNRMVSFCAAPLHMSLHI